MTALEGLVSFAHQRVDHVLAVLLEQQHHPGYVALHRPGSVVRAVVEVAVIGGLHGLLVGGLVARSGCALVSSSLALAMPSA